MRAAPPDRDAHRVAVPLSSSHWETVAPGGNPERPPDGKVVPLPGGPPRPPVNRRLGCRRDTTGRRLEAPARRFCCSSARARGDGAVAGHSRCRWFACAGSPYWRRPSRKAAGSWSCSYTSSCSCWCPQRYDDVVVGTTVVEVVVDGAEVDSSCGSGRAAGTRSGRRERARRGRDGAACRRGGRGTALLTWS